MPDDKQSKTIKMKQPFITTFFLIPQKERRIISSPLGLHHSTEAFYTQKAERVR